MDRDGGYCADLVALRAPDQPLMVIAAPRVQRAWTSKPSHVIVPDGRQTLFRLR
jgi:hypothetical protein